MRPADDVRPAAAAIVRQRIEKGGERLWRFDDFDDLPLMAVAQALSRLVKRGVVERLSRGTYYRARQTVFGTSRPNPSALLKLASRRSHLFPAGLSAASLLGFTTQTAGRREVATTARSLPRKLVGRDLVIHTRRPDAWTALSESDGALLDFLRRAGRTSELSPRDTIRRTQRLLAQPGRYQRLVLAAATEPPRVRALLGALGEVLGPRAAAASGLRRSLNPLSRFDFGLFAGLPSARSWFAKGAR